MKNLRLKIDVFVAFVGMYLIGGPLIIFNILIAPRSRKKRNIRENLPNHHLV